MKVALTGATGFVGGRLLETLECAELFIIGRSKPEGVADKDFHCSQIDAKAQYSSVFTGVDVVVHCAGRAHVMNDEALDPLAAFREVNTEGTLNLARQAAQAGVNRFVFVSTIKVNGESTASAEMFRPNDVFVPTDPYGLSKYEAEIGLLDIARRCAMEVVIIRPPLIYGPGVKANFSAMMRWVYRGVPLPLGGVLKNRRSLVSLDNLVDLIRVCIDHPGAVNQVFLVSDDEDLSTSVLINKMAGALGVANRALPVPESWMNFALVLIGKSAVAERLCGSLRVDISKTKELLGWQPPLTVDQGLKATAECFLRECH